MTDTSARPAVMPRNEAMKISASKIGAIFQNGRHYCFEAAVAADTVKTFRFGLKNQAVQARGKLHREMADVLIYDRGLIEVANKYPGLAASFHLNPRSFDADSAN